MTLPTLLFLIGFLFLNSCKKSNEKMEWIFVKGGTFEQGKNQIVVSPKGDSIKGFTSPHRVVINRSLLAEGI